jgi:hypothetical protein
MPPSSQSHHSNDGNIILEMCYNIIPETNSHRKEIYSGGRESIIKALTMKGAQSLKRLTPFFSDSILFLFLLSEF